MHRIGVPAVVAAFFFVSLAFTIPAHADTVTLDFSGSVDLTFFGGTSSNTFSGSVTYDPSTSPFFTSSSLAEYKAVIAGSFIFNGVDETANLVPSSSVTTITTQLPIPDMYIDLPFNPGFGPGPVSHIWLQLMGPPFSSLALPADTSFLTSVAFENSVWFTTGKSLGGTLTVSAPAPVPEPSTLTLMALGLVGAVARNRRRYLGSTP